MAYKTIKVPSHGEKIRLKSDHTLEVPERPILPFIEGDGTGPDIWRASQYVFDGAGKKAFKQFESWLPDETVEAFREYLIGIKGPLTTPVGGGIRSLNVALRQMLDLYACVRPVKYYKGIPSPVKHPERMNIVIYRENTEDVYAGIEVQEGTPEAKRLIELLHDEFGWTIRP